MGFIWFLSFFFAFVEARKSSSNPIFYFWFLLLGPKGNPDPTDFITAEINCIPFHRSPITVGDWAYSFKSWSFVIPGWRAWYLQVLATKAGYWDRCNISHCLNLSLGNPSANAALLSAMCYFWSDALNAFLFGHGPMLPTLLDVYALTNLDVTSPMNPTDL
jgi:hypothetical protein